MKNYRLRNYLSAVTWMVVGSVLVLGTVLTMNRLADDPERDEGRAGSQVEVQRRPEPKPKEVVEQPKPKPRPQRVPPPPNPLQGLDSSLAGIDVGIPAFTGGELGAADSLLGDTRDVVMTSDTVDVPPEPVRRGAMPYPPAARAKGTEGYVVLSILVDSEGRIERVKVLEASPGGVFEPVVLEGIRSWEFKPGMYKGEKVRSWVRQRISFNLS